MRRFEKIHAGTGNTQIKIESNWVTDEKHSEMGINDITPAHATSSEEEGGWVAYAPSAPIALTSRPSKDELEIIH